MGQEDTHAEASCNDVTRWRFGCALHGLPAPPMLGQVGMSPGVPPGQGVWNTSLDDQAASTLSPAWLLLGLAWLRALI
jgi:hypothetical protein